MAHDHDHHQLGARGHRADHVRRLSIALGLVLSYLVVQVVVGIVAHSLALLSDAGHMATDGLGLGMAVAAITLAERGSSHDRRTFGWYRLEILAALANAMLLFGVAVWVLIEAIGRLRHPHGVDGLTVLVVGGVGLLVNVVMFLVLRCGEGESMNMEGAYLEVLADLLGSAAVVVGAGLILLTGWKWIDPVLGVLIGLVVLPRAFRLAGRALGVLTQQAPAHVDTVAVARDLAAIDGVVGVHDLHVWTLTSGMDVLTSHLVVRPGTDHHAVLDRARELLHEQHRLEHSTLQVEPDTHEGCDDVGW